MTTENISDEAIQIVAYCEGKWRGYEDRLDKKKKIIILKYYVENYWKHFTISRWHNYLRKYLPYLMWSKIERLSISSGLSRVYNDRMAEIGRLFFKSVRPRRCHVQHANMDKTVMQIRLSPSFAGSRLRPTVRTLPIDSIPTLFIFLFP